MFCSKCGNEIDDSATVCMKCGCPTCNYVQQAQPMQSLGQVTTAPNTVVVVRTKKTDSKTLAIIIISVILIIVAIASYLIVTHDRSVFLSKKEMYDSVRGSHNDSSNYVSSYGMQYNYIYIYEDEVVIAHHSYFPMKSTDDLTFDDDSTYKIKRFDFLFGKIYFDGPKSNNYLIVKKNGEIVDKYGHVYEK